MRALEPEVAVFPAISIRRTVTAPPVGNAACSAAVLEVFKSRVADTAVAGVAMVTVPITEPFNRNSAWLRVESGVVQVDVIERFVLERFSVLATELPVIMKVGALGAVGASASTLTFEVPAIEFGPVETGKLKAALMLPGKSVKFPLPLHAPMAA